MSSTLLIGGTGTVGRALMAQWPVEKGALRVMTRRVPVPLLPAHMSAVPGDLTQPDTLERALDHIDSVFLVWTAPAAAVDRALACITERVRRVVFLSAPYKVDHPLFQASQPNAMSQLQARIEELIVSSGCEYTFVRPGMFAANARGWWGAQIRSGDVVRWPHLASVSAPIHEQDIAAVALRALCEEGHAGADYVITGPEPLSHFDQISLLGRVLGRSLRVEEMPADTAAEELRAIIPSPM